MNKRISITLFLSLVFLVGMNAQYRDLEGRYSLSVSSKLGKRWNIKLSEEFRLNGNSTNIYKHFTAIELKFKHKKWLNYQLGSRYYFDKSKDNYWNGSMRIYLDIILKTKLKLYSISARSRIQSSLNERNTIGRLHSKEALLREKIMIKYNYRKYRLKPFISAELFVEDYFVFGDSEDKKDISVKFESNKIRFKLGIEKKINRNNYLKIYYGYQQQLNRIINRGKYLISASYIYKIKTKKKDVPTNQTK